MRGCRSCFEPRHSTGTGEIDSSLGSQPEGGRAFSRPSAGTLDATKTPQRVTRTQPSGHYACVRGGRWTLVLLTLVVIIGAGCSHSGPSLTEVQIDGGNARGSFDATVTYAKAVTHGEDVRLFRFEHRLVGGTGVVLSVRGGSRTRSCGLRGQKHDAMAGRAAKLANRFVARRKPEPQRGHRSDQQCTRRFSRRDLSRSARVCGRRGSPGRSAHREAHRDHRYLELRQRQNCRSALAEERDRAIWRAWRTLWTRRH